MNTQTVRRAIVVADLAWIVAAGAVAYILRFGLTWNWLDKGLIGSFVIPLLAGLLLWYLFSSWFELDGFSGGWNRPALLSQLFVAISGLMLALLLLSYLRGGHVSHLIVFYCGVLLFPGFVAIRFAFHLHFKSLHRAGAVRRVVIVGSGALARELAIKIERHPEMLCRVVGFLRPAEAAVDNIALGCDSITTRTLGVVDILRPHDVDEVIIALPNPGHPEVLDLAARCRSHGVAVNLVPHPYDLYLSRTRLLDLDGLPLLQLKDAATVSDPISRRILDVVLGGCLLLLSVPPGLVAAGLLKYKKGRAFCHELRCGKNGDPFWMYRMNSERFAINLPRYEMLLQQLSVTELPQLWNVLRGEMSLVGPRPESPERVKHYSDWQRQRLNVKPGITGLAQVHGLRDQHSSEDKTRFDLQYMLNRSLFVDISLLLQTFCTLLGRLLQFPNFASRSRAGDLHPELSFEEGLTRAHSTQSSAD